MKPNPIFSENLLSQYISEFRLSSVTGVRYITSLIANLVKELESGKIDNSKEEEIKPRFISTFFGDILGFNYGNSYKWQLKDEKKSVIDGTKPDAALGYFFVDSSKDVVKAVIEIKGANTDLDKKQSGLSKQSPIDQAFAYASKSGGNCQWVIASNIKEIRFYPSLDRSKCQVFFLKDLIHESKLKELLFLFHKDRFIKENEKSQTDILFEKSKLFHPKNDKSIHIIDKLYYSLKRFEGLRFVDPNYIATIFPFNILDDHVWQYYNGNLFTINAEIYNLLVGLDFKNDELIFSHDLQKEISVALVIDAKYKIEWIFTFLNHSMVNEISAIKDYKQISARNKKTLGFSYRYHFNFKEGEEGITKNIQIVKQIPCDCVSCIFRSLDFNKLLSKLKVGEHNFECISAEYAYGNYLTATNNFKTTYSIYKTIEKELKGKEGKGVEYFLTKQNIKNLYNLASDYEFEDRQTILDDIKSIDLDRVIYDEIEFDVDKEVIKYLIDIKEDVLIYKIQDEIDETLFSIEKLKLLYANGGRQNSGPSLPDKLAHLYFLLYLHINRNFIIYDVFKRYKALVEKVFRGFVTCYNLPEYGIEAFNEFYLTEAILYIPLSSFQEILKNEVELKVIGDGVEKLLEKLNNLTSSIFKNGLFSKPYENSLLTGQLNNFHFIEKYTSIFANLFTVLSRLDINKEQFRKCIAPLINFLKIEKILAWFELKELSFFIRQKGYLFEITDLMAIFQIAVDGDKYGNHKYNDLIEQIPQSLDKFYPEFKIDNTKLISTAILKCSSDSGKNNDFNHLVYLVNICNDECRAILTSAFEKYLDDKFNACFYEKLLQKSNYDYKIKNYFQLYSEYTNLHRGGRAYKFGKKNLTDLVFINYIFILYNQQIDFNRTELKSFINLNDFETWLINPIRFDYKKFDPKWLTDINDRIILDRLKNIKAISYAIERELKNEFDPLLSEIKYKFFSNV